MIEGFTKCEKCGETYPSMYPHYTSDCKLRQDILCTKDDGGEE